MTVWAAFWSLQKAGSEMRVSSAVELGPELVFLKGSRGFPRPSLAATRAAASGLHSMWLPRLILVWDDTRGGFRVAASNAQAAAAQA